MDKLPPIPPVASKRRSYFIIALITVVALVVLIGGTLMIRSILASGITAGPDNMFGDQNLKTAVALIELHKVRYGQYPDSLGDLKFTGQWDQLALNSVSYHPNPDHTAYYIEVERGWIGKPTLKMPDEFWKGTGYDAALKPKTE
jgi:hypothetical protein